MTAMRIVCICKPAHRSNDPICPWKPGRRDAIDWKAVTVDTTIGVVVIAGAALVARHVGYLTDFPGWLMALIGAAGLISIGGALWEIGRPESLDRKAEIARYEKQLAEADDDWRSLHGENQAMFADLQFVNERADRLIRFLEDIARLDGLDDIAWARQHARDAITEHEQATAAKYPADAG